MQPSDNDSHVSSLPFRSHTALLLATALPFLQPAWRHPAELAAKFLELSETLQLYRQFHGTEQNPFSALLHPAPSSAQEQGGFAGLLNSFVLDMEGLLSGLTQVCNARERETFLMLLNLIRAKKFYETYGDVLNALMSSSVPEESAEAPPKEAPPKESPSEETPAGDNPTEGHPANGGFSMPDMSSLLSGGDLSSLLNKEQADTLNLLKNLLNAE